MDLDSFYNDSAFYVTCYECKFSVVIVHDHDRSNIPQVNTPQQFPPPSNIERVIVSD